MPTSQLSKRIATYLRQLLAFVMGQQGPERLEAGVDALHAPAFVAVGDLSPHPLLLLHVAARAGPAATAAASAVQGDVVAAVLVVMATARRRGRPASLVLAAAATARGAASRRGARRQRRLLLRYYRLVLVLRLLDVVDAYRVVDCFATAAIFERRK